MVHARLLISPQDHVHAKVLARIYANLQDPSIASVLVCCVIRQTIGLVNKAARAHQESAILRSLAFNLPLPALLFPGAHLLFKSSLNLHGFMQKWEVHVREAKAAEEGKKGRPGRLQRAADALQAWARIPRPCRDALKRADPFRVDELEMQIMDFLETQVRGAEPTSTKYLCGREWRVAG